MHMIYEEGENVSLVETLIRAGERIGLQGVKEYMQSNEVCVVTCSSSFFIDTCLSLIGI